MPVWHEAMKELRQRGDLVVVGITQEQHPERCALFRQWQQLDWPILWDPFNLTGAKVVPNFTAVDELGVVRQRRARQAGFEQSFVAREFAPLDAPSPRLPEPAYLEHLQTFLETPAGDRDHDALVAALEAAAARAPQDAQLRFRLGVALRLRYDSPARRPGDFQRAVDAWETALAQQPDQYIWRRRIQQYGPRMDKPYPFYTWVEQATAEVTARGERPVVLPVALAAAERAEPREDFVGAAAVEEPDPAGGVPRDDRFVRLEATVVHDSSGEQRVARVYLSLAPQASMQVSWDNAAGPLQVWVDDGGLPEGMELERRLLQAPSPPSERSTEERQLEWEVLIPAGSGAATLRGYAVYGICEDQTGACRWLRQDFEVKVSGSDE